MNAEFKSEEDRHSNMLTVNYISLLMLLLLYEYHYGYLELSWTAWLGKRHSCEMMRNEEDERLLNALVRGLVYFCCSLSLLSSFM